MKTALKIPLKLNARIKIEEGAIVERGETLVTFTDEVRDVEIDLAKILNIKPKDIFKYLKKKPSDTLYKNEILAEKKSILNTVSVKSPIKGKLNQVDLNRGVVLISHFEGKDSKLTSPVDCKVKTIGRDFIEIEIKADKINGIEGYGIEVTGELLNIDKYYNSVLEIGSDVEEKIVLINDAPSDIMAKLDTLGAIGIIAEKLSAEYNFPHITVNSGEFKGLSELKNKVVWLRPNHKEILILES